jgi:hypothetical protein
MHAHTHIDVNTGADGVRVVATNGPLVVGGGISNGKAYVDPKMGKKRAKQERKDAVAEAKAREHHFKEEIDLTTAAHKEARKAAIKFEKAREKEAMKERKLKEKEERERERMMLKMQK